jgi:hypothetical protein
MTRHLRRRLLSFVLTAAVARSSVGQGSSPDGGAGTGGRGGGVGGVAGGAPDAGASVCSLRCTFDKDCKETAFPTCQFGLSRGICSAPSSACTGV